MTPIRLLAILEAYTITGPAKNLLEFARLGRDEGVETVIATFTRDSRDNFFIRTARERGIQVEPIEESGAWDAGILEKLNAAFDRVRPDIVQTHAVKSHFLARRAGLPDRAPWVAFHHGYTWPTLKARLYNQLDRWSLRAARQVLTVSEPFRDELAAHGVARNRIEIVHNAIRPGWGTGGRAPEAAAALRTKWGIGNGRNVILIVGRLSREKDHLTLLEAIHRLPESVNAHLVVVGEGPERPRVEEKIRSLGMESRVTLAGQQDSAEPFYGIADVAVLSSLSEGSPNALLEAMAAGVPAVATRVGGIPEIVTHNESALLVDPGDAGGMSGAILAVLDGGDIGRRLAERSLALIPERHAPEIRVRRLAGIYRSVLRPR